MSTSNLIFVQRHSKHDVLCFWCRYVTSKKLPLTLVTIAIILITKHVSQFSLHFPSARQHPSYGDCLEVGNIIRTALCWIVWHSVRSPQHTYVSSSYRSNRLGLSHWDPYAVHRGSCLELYSCNTMEWFWWNSSLIFDDQLVSISALTLLVWSSGL